MGSLLAMGGTYISGFKSIAGVGSASIALVRRSEGGKVSPRVKAGSLHGCIDRVWTWRLGAHWRYYAAFVSA